MFKQIYLTLTGTTSPCQSGPGSNANEEVLHTSQILELDHRHQMQFSVLHGDSIFCKGYLFPSATRYCRSILSPADRVILSIRKTCINS